MGTRERSYWSAYFFGGLLVEGIAASGQLHVLWGACVWIVVYTLLQQSWFFANRTSAAVLEMRMFHNWQGVCYQD